MSFPLHDRSSTLAVCSSFPPCFAGAAGRASASLIMAEAASRPFKGEACDVMFGPLVLLSLLIAALHLHAAAAG